MSQIPVITPIGAVLEILAQKKRPAYGKPPAEVATVQVYHSCMTHVSDFFVNLV